MICAAGHFVLFCAYGLHSIIWNTQDGVMERSLAPAVMICEDGANGPQAFYSWSQSNCSQRRIHCSCMPFGPDAFEIYQLKLEAQ